MNSFYLKVTMISSPRSYVNRDKKEILKSGHGHSRKSSNGVTENGGSSSKDFERSLTFRSK